jgi:hypothetical protein
MGRFTRKSPTGGIHQALCEGEGGFYGYISRKNTLPLVLEIGTVT